MDAYCIVVILWLYNGHIQWSNCYRIDAIPSRYINKQPDAEKIYNYISKNWGFTLMQRKRERGRVMIIVTIAHKSRRCPQIPLLASERMQSLHSLTNC